MSSSKYVIGVDVGTGSARAGLFDTNGKLLSSAVVPIQMWRPRLDFVEQSSEDIWRSICSAVKTAIRNSDVLVESIVGISYDATCSLVVLDKAGAPLAVNDEGIHDRNIIVWMDHRSIAETEAMNAGDHDVLKFVGGKLSPEMEIPKLKWIKTHLPNTWASAGKFFDLADFLTFRSTGVDARSLCTVVCKWTFLGHEGKHGRWDKRFLKKVDLADILDDQKVVDDVRPMGAFLGYLTPTSASELGLSTNCAVGVGIIDAHAGGVGLLGAAWEGKGKPRLETLESALALIGGTSNCHMAVSRKPRFIDSIWGPYYGAMVPGMWLTEGGQSAAGSAIDHVIAQHPNAASLLSVAKKQKLTVYELLNAEVARIQAEEDRGPEITRNLHILPDFIGNRSPKADPHIRGTVDGISLDSSITSQAIQYYAAIQAVAYGTRDIIRTMNRAGYEIDTMYVTGGGTKNPLWLQEHADATGCTIVLPKEPDAVLLGSAILAAAAAGVYKDVVSAMQGMSGAGEIIKPRKETARYHRAKFRVFEDLYREQAARKAIMTSF